PRPRLIYQTPGGGAHAFVAGGCEADDSLCVTADECVEPLFVIGQSPGLAIGQSLPEGEGAGKHCKAPAGMVFLFVLDELGVPAVAFPGRVDTVYPGDTFLLRV